MDLFRLIDSVLGPPAGTVPGRRPSRRRRAVARATPAPVRRAVERRLGYAPRADGRPDPGEVVWAWVPYEDDPRQGKDRPVLVVGTEGTTLLGLALTSKDHDRDAEQERRAGRLWMDVGTGGWDRQGRPSEVRVNRVLRLAPEDVRREGAALDREVYDAVLRAAAPYLG
ncbi:type II toxin-antitoxin system PemK/MazF family toxin [Nocardioides marmoraquaticus]